MINTQKTTPKKKTPAKSQKPKKPREKEEQKGSAYPGLGQNAQHESPGGSPKEKRKNRNQNNKNLTTSKKEKPDHNFKLEKSCASLNLASPTTT